MTTENFGSVAVTDPPGACDAQLRTHELGSEYEAMIVDADRVGLGPRQRPVRFFPKNSEKGRVPLFLICASVTTARTVERGSCAAHRRTLRTTWEGVPVRFAIAIAVLVLSGIAFILGIGQRTIFAPPAEVSATAVVPIDADFAVIPAEAFDAEQGIPSVVVRAPSAFTAVGSQRDVTAWVTAVDHAEISMLPDLEGLTFDTVAGDPTAFAEDTGEGAGDTAGESAGEAPGAAEPGITPFDPRGSDLWVVERSAPDSSAPEVRLPVELHADESVLVAVAGGGGIGQSVSVVWAQDQSTPWAGPLLVTGGVLAVLGGVLYLLALDHNRRGLGPQRGRRGPLQGIRGSIDRRRESRRAKRVIAPAAVLIGALALSGCSADYWPDFSPSEEVPVTTPDQVSTLAPVPITSTQIDRIVKDVAATAEAGDVALDTSLIDGRFTGDALTQRAASYAIRAAVPGYDLVPPHISPEQLGYVLVQSTEGWPRTLFIAVASHQAEDPAAGDAPAEETTPPEDPTSPSLALVMTQESPHENYQVSRVIALRGGIAMPEAAPAEEGTALLSPDLQTLVLPPGEVGKAFAAVLQGGPDVAEASLFDLGEDPLIAKSGLAWVQQTQEKAAAEGYSIQYSVTARVGDEPLTALSTGVGGGLVAVTVIEERVSDTAGSTTRVRAEGAVAALSGLSGQQERIVSEVAHQLLFFVPSGTSGEKIQLLGATSELVGARN